MPMRNAAASSRYMRGWLAFQVKIICGAAIVARWPPASSSKLAFQSRPLKKIALAWARSAAMVSLLLSSR